MRMEQPRIVRVFPRRTSFTPSDEMAFVGNPPLWRPEADEVHVSVTFTWDLEEGKRLADAWGQYYPVVRLGGPAVEGTERDGPFVAGRYVKPGITFTTRGCIRRCPWCFVPTWEGALKCLPVVPGWIVQDNNLLAAPREHQEAVFEMLRRQGRRVTFSGGLDARLLDDWVAEQLRTVPIAQVFLAADTDEQLPALREAVKRLSFLTRDQLRCYVMVGRKETIAQSEERLRAVWDSGCLPFAMLYHDEQGRTPEGKEWKDLVRSWCRPALTKVILKERA